MKITNNYNTRNTNFNATPIYPIKLKKLVKGKYELADGFFSELSRQSAEDREVLMTMKEYCEGIASGIICSFENNRISRFFITQLRNASEYLYDSIVSIIEVSNRKNSALEVRGLESFFGSTNLSKPVIIGGGELALYGVVKKAMAEGNSEVFLTTLPEANSFYQHIGLKKRKQWLGFRKYYLPRDNFSDFLKKVEEKYQIQDKVNLIKTVNDMEK